jgi:teichuronic acid biosynthesis glycosyltransferase TuaC
MQTVRVLSLATLFPNAAQPRHGIFTLHRLSQLAAIEGIALRVVAPVPWFPSSHPMFGRYANYARAPRTSTQRGIEVVHPRYPAIPKIGMTVAPALMAAALLPQLLAIRATAFDFDVIDTYYLYPDSVAAVLLGALLHRPVLVTAFGSDVSLVPRYVLPREQLLWATRRAAAVTAVCRALKDRLSELGVPAQKIHVIHHGVDLSLFRPPADREALRRRLGFQCPTLISVGHLIQRKGHKFAIEALAVLSDTVLLIVGDGPDDQALRVLASHMGVADRVRFLGHVDQSLLPDLIGAADALVLCSDREGVANVLLEALACGTPVIATPVWGSPEIVTTPEAGLLLRDRSAASVVEGVRRLLALPPDRTATRQYAERFTWTDTAVRHAALIRTIIGAAPSPHPQPATV